MTTQPGQPTEAEIEAAAEALDGELLIGVTRVRMDAARAILAAILPAHDARIRAETLREAADALALLPPMLRDQYVNLLRLYAEEPWRLQDEMEGIDIAHIQTDHGCVISVNGQGHLPCSEHRATAEVGE